MNNELHRKTPIMGWASWNCFRTNISEEIIKQQADALISTGLAEYGYTYINMDDGFFGGRKENGILQFHKKRFPNGIKPVADYVHRLGLKAGIYADGGDTTCGFYYDNEGENGYNVGLYGHEEQDLKMYLDDCGFDFIKVDWCGGLRLGLNEKEQYTKIGRIIDKIRERTGRCIVYNICRWQFPGAWAAQVADSWRTGADIAPEFKSVLHQLDVIKPLARYCSPGHVNDLDMMQLGNGMSHEDEKTHFAMWCMMSTPLMIGCDLTKINESTLEILKNRELIAVNQDSACLQAFVIKTVSSQSGDILGEIWIKDLGRKNSNEKAIAFLNRSTDRLEMSLELSDAGLTGEITAVRDLCEHCDKPCSRMITVTLRPHETAVYRVKSESSEEIINTADTGEYKEKPLNKIAMDTAKKLTAEGAYLADVRSPSEYKKRHLDGAINVPYTEIHAVAGDFLKDKTRPVIVYCSTGKRSLQAKTSLDYLGYEKVYYLGGIKL